jgi:two-component system, chemotaxis family, sensor kinase CheA
MIEDEATREFLIESYEGLDQLDREFVALEADPTQLQRIATIFRIVHTIKGTAGFLGFTSLESLAHAGESLLVLLRDGTQPMTPPTASALLALVDKVRASLRNVEANGREPDDSHADLIARFNVLREQGPAAPPAQRPQPEVRQLEVPQPEVSQTEVAQPDALQPDVPQVDAARVHELPAEAQRADEPPAEGRPADVSAIAAASRASESPPASAELASPSVAETNIRVDVALLEELMNLVGELVLARNQILQFGAKIEDFSFVGASQRLNLITTELQERVMQTRMQPIGTVWSKLPRVVRDLAVACGKQVRVEMHGKDTELDRTILEAIKDPLTHIVRNAVDHGIETPADRAQNGKGKTGTLTMRAYHESGQVIVEIGDDGRGLDVTAIKAKALERGLAGPEQLEGMSEHELFQLVFLPGFSTARAVTNVSGRGVGMDVVKTNIERIGGTVDLASKAGQGTTLRVRIPLTLAIVPALIVVSGKQRFAVPQANLLELVRLEGQAARTGIESVHGTPVYRLRGRLLPLVMLNHVVSGAPPLRHGDPVLAGTATDAEPILNIVVLQTGTGNLGLVVDEVRDTEEIVVKPLGKELRGIPLFAGATIMGDGRVALILDVAGVAQHVSTAARGRADGRNRKDDAADVTGSEAKQSDDALLLFEVGRGDLTAVPVSRVTRIEEFPHDRLERSGENIVVQYRGEILPLIELQSGTQSDALVTVLVFTEGKRSIGLLVQRIIDVVDESYRVERCTSRPGVLGTVVVQNRVTDLLDVRGVISRKAPWFYQEAAA